MTPRRLFALGALALGAAPPLARAQGGPDWPARPVTVIVPWPAGGPTDAFARVLSERLGRDLGRPFVVENRGGAAGSIGMLAAARARPDGHTLVIAPNSTYAIAQHLYPVQYDQERDFAGVSLLVSSPLFILVRGDAPYRSLAEYLEAARRPGQRMTHAISGVGATSQLAIEMMKQMANVEIQEIAYRGGGPALQAVLAGEAGMLAMPAAAAMPQIASGALRALAATTRARTPFAPDVPTFEELGFRGFEVVEHVALLAPAGTPEPLLRRLNAAATAALRAPDMQPRWQQMALTVEAQPLEAWPEYFRAESDKWRDFIRARGIRVQ
ncbi:MAG: tripartite tricarboxylate transporter substrate binding protein [Roseococcus sp.]|nr:tripartite tricarboxylate transporter substrate binding protein [Roseococcus sp.]